MTVLAEARAHLRKAEEFLELAELAESRDLFNGAASAAVTSGINAKDAVCLKLVGHTDKTESHSDAVVELKAAGPAAAPLATTLGRLLKLKNRSQYQPVGVARSDARKAIEWARRLYEAAVAIVTDN